MPSLENGSLLGTQNATETVVSVRVMASQWGGKCACGVRVLPGGMIGYDGEAEQKIVQCVVCTPELAAQDPTASMQGAEAAFTCTVRSIKPLGNAGVYFAAQVVFAGIPPTNAPLGPHRGFEVTGKFARTNVDDTVEVRGIWSKHERYGWQFKASTVVPVIAHTEQALRAFLSKFPFIGPVVATDIVRHFGGREATLHILENEPARLAEVKGLNAARAAEIGKAYAASRVLRDVAIWLAGLGLTENLTAKILDAWGEEAKGIIDEDPYRIMDLPRMGFLATDEVCRTKLGIAIDDPRRVTAAVLYFLEDQEEGFDGGHTYVSEQELTGYVFIPEGQRIAWGGAAPAGAPPTGPMTSLAFPVAPLAAPDDALDTPTPVATAPLVIFGFASLGGRS